MKRKAVSGILLTMFLVSVSVTMFQAIPPVRGNPEVLFEENFESYVVGTFPSDKFDAYWGGWSVTQEETNKFLRSVPYPESDYVLRTQQRFPRNTTVEFMHRSDASGVPSGFPMILLATNPIPQVIFPGYWAITLDVYSGKAWFSWSYSPDGVSGEYHVFDMGPPPFSIQPGVWYKTKAALSGRYVKFYIDDSLIYEYDVSSFPFIIADFFVVWTTWGQKDIDNIKVYETLPPVVTATVDIHPQALNLRSRGRWITAYIELPEGYDASDINASTIMLNDTISAELRPIAIGDYDNDAVSDLMVKFNRASVISCILENTDLEERFMTATLTITGQLNDGTPFMGSDTIKTIHGMHCCRTFRSERYLQYLGMFPM